MKKVYVLLLLVVMCLSLVACDNNEISNSEENMEPMSTEIIEESSETSDDNEDDNEENNEDDIEFISPMLEIQEIIDSFGDATLAEFVESALTPEFNQQVTVDRLLEFSLKNVYQADTIGPTNPDGFYNTYNAESGEVFIVIEGKVKNLSNHTLDFGNNNGISNAITNLIVNESEILGGNYVLEKEDLSDITGELKPAQTSSLRLIFSVSSEVANDINSLYLLLGFGNLVDDGVMGFGVIQLDKCTNRYFFEVPVQ